jgi:hypothetical protein
MTDLQVVTSTWSGFVGAPGYSKFLFNNAAYSTNQAAVAAFWGFIADLLPSDVHIDTFNTGDTIDDATGAVVGAWVGGSDTSHVGTDTGAYSAASGGHVNWSTATVLTKPRRSGPRIGVSHSYKLRGRTFVVPVGGSSYEADGTLLDGRQAVLAVAAGNLITAAGGHFVIYSRPSTDTATDGVAGAVVASAVPAKVAVLRSRRD